VGGVSGTTKTCGAGGTGRGAALRIRGVAVVAAAFAAISLATTTAAEPRVSHTNGHADKKGPSAEGPETAEPAGGQPLLGTLVDTHSEERVPLDAEGPPLERFGALLGDRVTGAQHAMDPRLLGMLRALAAKHADAGPVRIELVSGYRSPKLNEMLRKKGHHVASHSQHSLGHAVDFRLVLPGADRGIDPRTIEREVRELGWTGGTGVYLSQSDWFVHVDVGPQRRWAG
jgi:uncharacterized protein YcbK (DUF882 family)